MQFLNHLIRYTLKVTALISYISISKSMGKTLNEQIIRLLKSKFSQNVSVMCAGYL